MAIFEPPTIPDPAPQEQTRSTPSNSPYADMEHHELLQLIDELNDDRARARFREGMWMAFFAHLVLFALLFFMPKWIFHTAKVISPTDVMRDRERDIALATPSDLADVAKNLDKNRAGRPKSPPQTNAPSQQMLRQLAAEEAARKKMQREQTPQPPTPQPPSPTPPPPVAKNEPLLPMPNVRPQSSLPDMPSPNAPSQNNQSAKDTGDDQFNNQIRAAARAAMKGNKGGMTYGQGGAGGGKNRGLAAGMGIISDTQGVNFDAWLQRLQYIIQHSWEPQIPESARPPLNKQGVTGIRFTIDKDGTLEGNMVLETPSGDVALDKAAWSAITGPQPFPPLPKEFHGKNIIIRGGFFYNIPPE